MSIQPQPGWPLLETNPNPVREMPTCRVGLRGWQGLLGWWCVPGCRRCLGLGSQSRDGSGQGGAGVGAGRGHLHSQPLQLPVWGLVLGIPCWGRRSCLLGAERSSNLCLIAACLPSESANTGVEVTGLWGGAHTICLTSPSGVKNSTELWAQRGLRCSRLAPGPRAPAARWRPEVLTLPGSVFGF